MYMYTPACDDPCKYMREYILLVSSEFQGAFLHASDTFSITHFLLSILFPDILTNTILDIFVDRGSFMREYSNIIGKR